MQGWRQVSNHRCVCAVVCSVPYVRIFPAYVIHVDVSTNSLCGMQGWRQVASPRYVRAPLMNRDRLHIHTLCYVMPVYAIIVYVIIDLYVVCRDGDKLRVLPCSHRFHKVWGGGESLVYPRVQELV